MMKSDDDMTEDQKFEHDLLEDLADLEKTKLKITAERDTLQEIKVALCEKYDRCTVCYRYMSVTDRANCGGCEEYYCECNCTPLTPDQIINGEFP